MRRKITVACGLLLVLLCQAAHGTSPRPDELDEAHRSAKAKFQGVRQKKLPEASLTVMANNDPVQKNSRAGKPLKIAGKEYRRGLYCHAQSKVVVHLPGKGKRFTAVVGVDSNNQTTGGQGSVVFSVAVAGKSVFRSKVMREATPGVRVTADLRGATQLVLNVSDAGDGITCDQADWADANVVLADGRVFWLGDLPILGPRRGLYTTEPPFSFTYGGQPAARAMRTWKRHYSCEKLDNRRSRHTLRFSDPKTGLVVRCVAVEYHDFPTVEWTVYFKNTGAKDTPVLSDVQALDTRFDGNGQGEFVLHHHVGSPAKALDYQPLMTELKADTEKRIATSGGRPTNSDLPYFNIETPGEGVIVAIGWPGQWAARFTRDAANSLRVRGGQELTHFKLHPGEEVRTPLVAVQFWKGDWIRSQNIWRRWMMAHNVPRPGGKQLAPQMAACSSHQFGEMIHADSKSQKFFVDRYLAEKLKLDYWWMDAGWYVNKTGWPNTGTWEVDTKRFPGGLRPITDHAHAKGVKTIVWFEPERVTPGTWLYENHRDWLLGIDGQHKLLNLGNPKARAWLTDHVDKLLTEQGIDLYRQDFNTDPLAFWRANDSPDRQGITEIRHVTGYLAYWDELRRRHPKMLIDSCASGGRRNDLETLRRAVPLLRSDYILEPVGNQNHTYGIAFWMPFHGTGVNQFEPYGFRSCMCPHITACYDMRRKDLNFDTVRKLTHQWREQIASNYLGDYYPLTSYSRSRDVWMAWQFDRPEVGEGVVQAFRRADCIYEAARLKLRGLDPDADYTISDLDASGSLKRSGRELMTRGLRVQISDRPGSAVIAYKRRGTRKAAGPTRGQ